MWVGGEPASAGGAGGVVHGAEDGHGVVGPGIVGAEWELPGVVFGTFAVGEPVADLELEPGGGEEVEGGGGGEVLAGEELGGDDARTRRHDGLGGLLTGLRDGDVAAEAGIGGAHKGAFEIVVGAVGGAEGGYRGLRRIGQGGCCGGFGGEEVGAAELVADADEEDETDGRRKGAPVAMLVDAGAGIVEAGGELLLDGWGGEELIEGVAGGRDSAERADGLEG